MGAVGAGRDDRRKRRRAESGPLERGVDAAWRRPVRSAPAATIWRSDRATSDNVARRAAERRDLESVFDEPLVLDQVLGRHERDACRGAFPGPECGQRDVAAFDGDAKVRAARQDRRERQVVALRHARDGDTRDPAQLDALTHRGVIAAVDDEPGVRRRHHQQAGRSRESGEVRDVHERRHHDGINVVRDVASKRMESSGPIWPEHIGHRKASACERLRRQREAARLDAAQEPLERDQPGGFAAGRNRHHLRQNRLDLDDEGRGRLEIEG